MPRVSILRDTQQEAICTPEALKAFLPRFQSRAQVSTDRIVDIANKISFGSASQIIKF